LIQLSLCSTAFFGKERRMSIKAVVRKKQGHVQKVVRQKKVVSKKKVTCRKLSAKKIAVRQKIVVTKK
jgi:hypothetical protein